MKFIGLFLLLYFALGVPTKAEMKRKVNKKEHAAVVAGIYNGEAIIEMMQFKMNLKLELQRIHRDSVVAVVKDVVLPTGQKFSYRSKAISVKPEVQNGKTVYRLDISFPYTYNGMPMKVVVTGTVIDGMLDALTKATIMDAMEIKATYKAKKE